MKATALVGVLAAVLGGSAAMADVTGMECRLGKHTLPEGKYVIEMGVSGIQDPVHCNSRWVGLFSSEVKIGEGEKPGDTPLGLFYPSDEGLFRFLEGPCGPNSQGGNPESTTDIAIYKTGFLGLTTLLMKTAFTFKHADFEAQSSYEVTKFKARHIGATIVCEPK